MVQNHIEGIGCSTYVPVAWSAAPAFGPVSAVTITCSVMPLLREKHISTVGSDSGTVTFSISMLTSTTAHTAMSIMISYHHHNIIIIYQFYNNVVNMFTGVLSSIECWEPLCIKYVKTDL